jgi:hypothetical protein
VNTTLTVEQENGWRTYTRVGSIEARPWTEDDFQAWTDQRFGISVSDADVPLAHRLPTCGFVARNTDNHLDQWYIAPDYFAKHYAPSAELGRMGGEKSRAGRWLCSKHTEPTKGCEECYNFWRALVEGIQKVTPTPPAGNAPDDDGSKPVFAPPADVPLTQCPRCKQRIEDHDGFGVLYHEACGYCVHASRTNSVCDFCGDRAPADVQAVCETCKRVQCVCTGLAPIEGWCSHCGRPESTGKHMQDSEHGLVCTFDDVKKPADVPKCEVCGGDKRYLHRIVGAPGREMTVSDPCSGCCAPMLSEEQRQQEQDATRYRFFRDSFKSQGQLITLARMLGCKHDSLLPSLDYAIDSALLTRAAEGKESGE